MTIVTMMAIWTMMIVCDDDGGGDELMMITVHGTFFYLNVEKMLVVERFLPNPPPPSLSRGFIAAKLI